MACVITASLVCDLLDFLRSDSIFGGRSGTGNVACYRRGSWPVAAWLFPNSSIGQSLQRISLGLLDCQQLPLAPLACHSSFFADGCVCWGGGPEWVVVVMLCWGEAPWGGGGGLGGGRWMGQWFDVSTLAGFNGSLTLSGNFSDFHYVLQWLSLCRSWLRLN